MMGSDGHDAKETKATDASEIIVGFDCNSHDSTTF